MKPKCSTIQILITLKCSLLLLVTGCSTFSTKQVDRRYNEKTGEKTEIETIVKAKSFWDSKSALSQFEARQTENNQGAKVGNLDQQSTSTNTVEALKSIQSILGK